MGYNVNLTNTLRALTTTVTGMQPLATPAAPTPLLDPFQHDQPFDLSCHTGAAAFIVPSGPLNVTWDSTADHFPSFIITLCIHTTKAHWNMNALHGILDVGGNNILTNYSNINNAKVTATHLTHTNP